MRKRGSIRLLDFGTGFRFVFEKGRKTKLRVAKAQAKRPFPFAVLGSGSVRDRLGGQKVVRKALGVAGEELLEPVVIGRLQYEPGMMVFIDPVEDFRIRVSRCIGMLLAS
jgi:hypothetical protein